MMPLAKKQAFYIQYSLFSNEHGEHLKITLLQEKGLF
jgi:hypothetical protein